MTIKKFIKDIFIISTITIFLLLGIESFFRLYKIFLVRNNINKYRTDKFYRDLEIAFDGKYSVEEIKKIDNQTRSNNIFIPWLQLGNPELNTKYSKVKNGIRKTYNQKNIFCKNNLNIWFFGGSTMFGTGIPWQDSIPSNVSKIMQEKDFCINAINYGTPSHNLEVEIKKFIGLILENPDKTPDYVVFLDGINDVAQPGSLIRGETSITPLIRESLKITKKNEAYTFRFPLKIELEIVNYFRRKLTKSDNYYRNNELPYGYKEEQLPEIYVQKFNKSKNFLNKFCGAFNADCYMFLQPTSYIDYPNFRKYAVTNTCPSNFIEARYKSIYPALEKNVYKKNKFKNVYSYSLISSFKDYKNGIPYVDCAHYSPRGSRKIAEQIVSDILSKKVR